MGAGARLDDRFLDQILVRLGDVRLGRVAFRRIGHQFKNGVAGSQHRREVAMWLGDQIEHAA